MISVHFFVCLSSFLDTTTTANRLKSLRVDGQQGYSNMKSIISMASYMLIAWFATRCLLMVWGWCTSLLLWKWGQTEPKSFLVNWTPSSNDDENDDVAVVDGLAVVIVMLVLVRIVEAGILGVDCMICNTLSADNDEDDVSTDGAKVIPGQLATWQWGRMSMM